MEAQTVTLGVQLYRRGHAVTLHHGIVVPANRERYRGRCRGWYRGRYRERNMERYTGWYRERYRGRYRGQAGRGGGGASREGLWCIGADM